MYTINSIYQNFLSTTYEFCILLQEILYLCYILQ